MAEFPYCREYGFKKTTIDFPDELLHRAKILAAEERTTLRETMVCALPQATEPEADARLQEREAVFRNLIEEMKASNTQPIQPLTRDEAHDR